MVKKIFFYWAPSIVWMLVIFYLSSRQRTSITSDFLVDFIIFKTLHMLEYATLFFLLFRSMTTVNELKLSKKFTLSFIIAALYSVSDELHQTFVPSREGTIRDVFIDCLGIFLMYIYIKNHLNLIKDFLWKNSSSG